MAALGWQGPLADAILTAVQCEAIQRARREDVAAVLRMVSSTLLEAPVYGYLISVVVYRCGIAEKKFRKKRLADKLADYNSGESILC
jgi:hypothetical protein